MRFERIRGLLGNEAFEKLRCAKILLLGVGGVGGFALDALFRSGVSHITIVDCDSFDTSNQNRQIGSQFVGEKKVDVLQRLYPSTSALFQKVTPTWVESFDFSSYCLVLDAIDDMGAKVALAHRCSPKLISSTGSARKLNPTMVQYGSIWETQGDKLAKKFRYELRKSGFSGDFSCIYSKEEPYCEGLGSFVGVTGTFGLALASLAVQRLIES